ncbi:hypothetical protein WKI65_07570 [Streptomyces sp. MS1.AVA.3]|uniref:hypothetical protein n=1 Tax=Streptomyces decoyicus TaxID=249567 RepID=UPI0030C0D161
MRPLDMGAAVHKSPSGSSKIVDRGMSSFTTYCSKPGDGHRWWYGVTGGNKPRGWVWGAYLH